LIKRIDFLINSLRGGGAERVLVTLANKFIEKGYKVTVTVLNLDNAIFADDLDHRIELKSLNTKHARRSLIALINNYKYSNINRLLVFNHQLVILMLLVRKILRRDFYIIARNINNLSNKRDKEKSLWHKYIVFNIIKLFYKKVDYVICQSQGMAEDLQTNFNVPKKKISVINNPVSTKIKIRSNEGKDIIKNDNKKILFIGKLTEQKGIFYLLEAFNQLIKGLDNKVYLNIVGEGPLRSQIEEYISANNLTGHVFLKGFADDVEQYYSNSDLVVLTSLYEGFPNVLIESLTFGIPVVSFDCPSGPKEIIQNGVNGYLVEHLNVNKLVYYIKKALKEKWDKEIIKIGANKYSADSIATEYLTVLNNF